MSGPRGVQGTPNGALGSPRDPKRIPRVRKTDPEVQVLYSGLCIERIVFEVWIPRFICQVLYSKFYIRGVLYSKVSIPGVYSKFHVLGFLFLALYSKFKARWRGGRRQLDIYIYMLYIFDVFVYILPNLKILTLPQANPSFGPFRHMLPFFGCTT